MTELRFDRLERHATKAGLALVRCSVTHWQVRGGPNLVNYYPTTGTVYVNGTDTSREETFDPARVVALAKGAPPMLRPTARPERMSHQRAQRIRKRLCKKRPRCHWCDVALTYETSTLDHRIPLARGGSNLPDNLVLACSPCNQKRGHDMPELGDVAREQQA